MEEDSVPKLIPYYLISVEESPQQKALRLSYNWRMTEHGWLRMDKKKNQEPSAPKEIAPQDFFGQCFDEDENCWMQCFEFDKDGNIDSDDTYFHKVRSAAGNIEVDLDKALSLVANVSKAAGAIFILTGSLRLHLSGFFIADRFFLTCAHFAISATVEEAIKKSGSKMATVCTDHKIRNNNKTVHLVFRDEVRDFAIFCLDKDQRPQSPHLDLDQNFPGIDQLDFMTEIANRRAFAIGYNSRAHAANFPWTRENVIQNLTPEKKLRVLATSTVAPEFEDVFLPNRKTLSVGRLDSNPPERNAIMWKHRITGWHGISGAMIACLDQPSTAEARVQVLGLFRRGDEGNKNEMVPLTSEIIKVIRATIQSYPSSN
ncbi:hypothetical protein EPUS_08035 [Endocarpon pusillum Z07020]|uniref:Uncharacterized protein n=1 Tax=Endocarpon pusillum (strain Z07020 / HMAS-L-300199) TaxID=1263415 RepID=U1HLF4_ENDPU|nr:uncharacterized protein EPUS_08035 [Endocarpon pusillum Z07020]ERF69834.1 hypothetical protein EPUS_08035 [Endocarpon pusillum Z07020]